MEPLWSPWSQPAAITRKSTGPETQKQAKSFATGCHRLPETFHGKEGVDGSSPSEGSAKAPHVGAFLFRSTCRDCSVRWVWSRLWSFHVSDHAPSRGLRRARCARLRRPAKSGGL